MFDVSASLLRYWESEFTQLKPQKTRRGDRKYTKKDIQAIQNIYTLVKDRGFTLDGAKKELKHSNQDNSHSNLVIKLKELRAKMIYLRDQL